MIDFIKIQTEINKLLVKQYPEFTVYINKTPDEFERPSFLIEYINNSSEQVSCNTISESVYYTVTYYGPVDDFYNTDRLDLQSVLVNILKLFRKGFLAVEDRAINVKASSGGMNDNEIYMDLQFEYYEDRLEDEENPDNTYVKMGEINKN